MPSADCRLFCLARSVLKPRILIYDAILSFFTVSVKASVPTIDSRYSAVKYNVKQGEFIKDALNPTLTGEIWGAFCELFGEKLPRDIKTLYVVFQSTLSISWNMFSAMNVVISPFQRNSLPVTLTMTKGGLRFNSDTVTQFQVRL